MNTEFWIGELGRLYERSTEAISDNRSKAVEPLADEFNEALENLKNEFSDNPIVTSTDQVESHTEGATGKIAGMHTTVPPSLRNEALHEIRSRCERMANAIGYELPEIETGDRSPNRMVMISVDSSQETTQEVHQVVTIEQIQNMIQSPGRPVEEKAELQEILNEFEAEVEGEQDQSSLRQLLAKANEISTDVATQMAVFALTHGAIAVLGL